jgi:hypothetical protein
LVWLEQTGLEAAENAAADSRARDAISAAGNFMEEFAGPGPDVPVSVLKAVVVVVEDVLREKSSREPINASQETRA